MIGDFLLFVLCCSAFTGFLSISEVILDRITYKKEIRSKKQLRHKYDNVKIMQTAEMMALAQHYIKEDC